MPLYSVWIGYRGYDVNALVKAKNKRAARSTLLKNLELQSSVTLVTPQWEEEMYVDRAAIAKIRKAKDGTVHVYDEGT